MMIAKTMNRTTKHPMMLWVNEQLELFGSLHHSSQTGFLNVNVAYTFEARASRSA